MATLDRPPLTREPPRRLSEAELAQRWQQAFPEAAGPGTESESGYVDYTQPPGNVRVGPIPKLLDDATRERDAAARAAALAALTPEQRAAQDGMREMIRAELRNLRG